MLRKDGQVAPCFSPGCHVKDGERGNDGSCPEPQNNRGKAGRALVGNWCHTLVGNWCHIEAFIVGKLMPLRPLSEFPRALSAAVEIGAPNKKRQKQTPHRKTAQRIPFKAMNPGKENMT